MNGLPGWVIAEWSFRSSTCRFVALLRCLMVLVRHQASKDAELSEPGIDELRSLVNSFSQAIHALIDGERASPGSNGGRSRTRGLP